jgi:hypothetical protein
MKHACLQIRAERVQTQTACHVHNQQLRSKTFHALRCFARYSAKAKALDNKGKSGDKARLLCKYWSTWMVYHRQTQAQSLKLFQACSQRSSTLATMALGALRQNVQVLQHERSLIHFSNSYYQLCLKRVAVSAFQHFVKLKQSERE